jgi:hypothetical protein
MKSIFWTLANATDEKVLEFLPSKHKNGPSITTEIIE